MKQNTKIGSTQMIPSINIFRENLDTTPEKSKMLFKRFFDKEIFGISMLIKKGRKKNKKLNDI